MGFWDDLKSAFGGGSSSSDKDRSGGRGTGGGASTLDKISTDIKMGLSTFGLGGEAQAEKLRDLGYSDKAIKSYQERTERSKQSLMTAGSDDDGPSRTVAEEPEAEEEATDEVTPVDIVAEVPEAPTTVRRRRPPPPPKPDPVYKGRRIEPPAGQTESEAMEAGQRGRKSTIATSPTGLLDEPEVRRRSLMGGLIS